MGPAGDATHAQRRHLLDAGGMRGAHCPGNDDGTGLELGSLDAIERGEGEGRGRQHESGQSGLGDHGRLLFGKEAWLPFDGQELREGAGRTDVLASTKKRISSDRRRLLRCRYE